MNMSKKSERKVRDWSALLPFALIMMVVSAAVGLVASVINISESSKTRLLDAYVASTVTFSVVGYGNYEEESPDTIFELYIPSSLTDTIKNSLFGKTYTKATKNMLQVYKFENPDANLLSELISIAEKYESATYSFKYVQKNSKSTAVTCAYDEAYEEALSKATLIAGNTGKNWRITQVEELSTIFDESTGITSSEVKMSFAVSDN